MPIRSVNLTATEAIALRELSNRFHSSDLAHKAALSAVKKRCARLAGVRSSNEVAVLCKGINRIDVVHRDEYTSNAHKNLWEF